MGLKFDVIITLLLMSYSQLVWSEDLPIQLVGNQTQKETVWPGVMGYAAELPYKKAFH